MIFGNTTIGTDHEVLDSGPGPQWDYLFDLDAPDTALAVATIVAYIDGAGGGVGNQQLRGVITDDSDRTFVSDPIVVAAGAAPARLEFRFPDPPTLLKGVDLKFGVRASPTANVARLYGDTTTGAGHIVGDSAPGGSINLDGSVFLVAVEHYQPPANVTDLYLSRLPWSAAQEALGATGPVSGSAIAATAGWHGRAVSPEQGAVCIVRADGPLAEAVGERLRVTYRTGTAERHVAVFCLEEQDFGDEAADEDLSLSQDAFRHLAPLALDGILVEVETYS